MLFRYQQGSPIFLCQINQKLNSHNRVYTTDWAIIRINQRLGDQYGWMRVKAIPAQNLVGKTVNAAGYSIDFQDGRKPGIHANCSIREVVAHYGSVTSDCDCARGASGGPIFVWEGGKPTIVGVMVGEQRGGGETSLNVDQYSLGRANVVNPVSNFKDTLQRIATNSRAFDPPAVDARTPTQAIHAKIHLVTIGVSNVTKIENFRGCHRQVQAIAPGLHAPNDFPSKMVGSAASVEVLERVLKLSCVDYVSYNIGSGEQKSIFKQ